MMVGKPRQKTAILSHVLPPSSSGQAVVLFRLLEGLPPASYCLISRENYDGIPHACAATKKLSGRYHHLGPIFQLPIINQFQLSVLSIAINAFWGIVKRTRQVTRILERQKCKLLIGCTGDLYDLPAGYLACKRGGIPFVPYIFDDFIYQWTGIYRSISRLLEPAILRHANGLIVTNEYMQKAYMQRYNLSSTVIHNPCSLPNFVELDKAKKMFNIDETNIVYTGAIYHAHYDAFRSLIAAIEQLQREDVKLHLYTAQTESSLILNGISGNMVVYHAHINNFEVPNVLRQAQVLFLPLAFDSPIPQVIRTASPGKLGDYLSVGRPIVVHAPKDSFVAQYFRTNNCGMVVEENDPQELSRRIGQLMRNEQMKMELGRQARKMAERDFNVDNVRKRFVQLQDVVIGN